MDVYWSGAVTVQNKSTIECEKVKHCFSISCSGICSTFFYTHVSSLKFEAKCIIQCFWVHARTIQHFSLSLTGILRVFL